MRVKKYFNSFFVLLAFMLFSQQQVKLIGQVVDQESEPLEGAHISIYQQDKLIKGTDTDEKGSFILYLPKGVYRLEIDFFGNLQQTIDNLEMESNKKLNLIILKEETNNIDAVVITGEKKILEYDLDKKIYNVSLDKTLVGSTALDALDNAPSIDVDAEGNISLRGEDDITILIDGKPSSLVSTSNIDILRSLSADAIEKIEVMTVPSVKYDADGATGIINIIMKTEKNMGINGSAFLSAGYPLLTGASVNLNKRNKKYSIYTSLNFNYRESPGSRSGFHHYFGKESKPDFISSSAQHIENKSRNTFINAGVDYNLNDNNRLSFNGKIANKNGNNLTDITYDEYYSNDTSNRLLRIRNENKKQEKLRLETELTYVHEFEKKNHKFSADAKFNYTQDDENSEIEQKSKIKSLQKINVYEKVKNYLFQADYTLPVTEKGLFETGVKLDHRNFSNDYAMLDLEDITNKYNSNNFAHIQQVEAAYAQFGNRVNSFSYSIGLRLEHTHITIDNAEIRHEQFYSFKKNYTDLFPSLHLNYRFNNENSIQLAYNRRIKRPRTRSLNPFLSLSDDTNIFHGNPDLDPSYTNAFEIGYLYSLSKLTLLPTLYYNYSNKPFQFFTERLTNNQGNNFIKNYPVNLDNETRYGFELNGTYKISKKMSISGDFNYFKAYRKGTIIDSNEEIRNQSIHNERLFARLRVNYELPYSISLKIREKYRGKFTGKETTIKPIFFTNLSLSKDFFKKKGSLTFNISDVFNTRKLGRTARTTSYFSDTDFQWTERRYTIGFNYRFGNNKNKTKSEKSQPENEEDFLRF